MALSRFYDENSFGLLTAKLSDFCINAKQGLFRQLQTISPKPKMVSFSILNQERPTIKAIYFRSNEERSP